MIKMIEVHIFYKLFEYKKAGISNYIFLCLPLSFVTLCSVHNGCGSVDEFPIRL